jgi:P4 family phage/plasmid primase-like protien
MSEITTSTIHETLSDLFKDGDAIVISHTVIGSDGLIKKPFNRIDAAAAHAEALDRDPQTTNIYVNLQKLKPGSITDKRRDADQYVRFLVDVDRKNKKVDGIRAMASEEEKSELYQVVVQVIQWVDALLKTGTHPLIADSGNGYHICWTLLPRAFERFIPCGHDSQIILEEALKALSQKFDSEAVEIDISVGEPEQIIRLWGTWNRRSPETLGRPHRQSGILHNGRGKGIHIYELDALARTYHRREDTDSGPRGNAPPVHKDFDAGKWWDHYAPVFHYVETHNNWLVTNICPPTYEGEDSPGHRHTGSALSGFRFDRGRCEFHCFSDHDQMSFGQVMKHIHKQGFPPYQGPIWDYSEIDEEIAQEFGLTEKSAACVGTSPKVFHVCTHEEKFTLSADMSGTARGFKAKVQPLSPNMYPMEKNLPKNDTGVARRLVRLCGFDILFVEDKNAWYVWDGRYWVEDKQRVRMFQKTKDAVETMLMEVGGMKKETDEDKENIQAFVKWVFRMQDTHKLEAVIKNAASEAPRINMMDFNPDGLLFNTMNGTIDLRTGQPRDYDRRDLITRISCIPFTPGADRASFEKFLREIFPTDTDEKIAFLKRWMGYCLTGLCDEEAFLIGYGKGRNGKGKLNDTFMFIFGDVQRGGYGHAANFDIFVAKRGDEGKPHDVAEMHGSRYVSASEGEQSKRLNVAKMKALVSGDYVTGEKKYQDSFTYRPEHKINLFSNYKPRIIETDDGIWDKLFLLEFNRYFAAHERDKKLREKLFACAPGVLNWMIEGCLEWQRDGLKVPECVRAFTTKFRADQHVLSQFIEDEEVLGDHLTTQKTPMYVCYKAWAEKHGEFVMTSTEFTERMSLQFEEGRSSTKGRHWKGIGLKGTFDADLHERETTVGEIEKSIN